MVEMEILKLRNDMLENRVRDLRESISGVSDSPKREKICRTPVPGGYLYRHSVVEYTRTNAEQLLISIAFVSEKDL